MKLLLNHRFLLSLSAITMSAPLYAGSPDKDVWPKPQMVSVAGEGGFPASALEVSQLEKFPVLAGALKKAGITASGEISIKVTTGDSGKTQLAELNKDAAKVVGGYALEVSEKEVKITAASEAGVYYATQTLAQMIEADGKLVTCKVVDWPDMDFRGSIEGFYGKPWEHERRISQIEFYGKYKMNAYIYGPKDDPYSGFNSQKWRDFYPDEQAKQLTELVKVADENQVNFIWALHPGSSIRWDDQDGDGIADDTIIAMKKLEAMYELGVRSFAVFFDDIGGEGAKGEKQAEMLNYLNREFIKKKDDVEPLLMCPTDYAGAHGSDYKKALGEKLDKDVNIMWTGPGICSDIPAGPTKEVSKFWQRKPFIWWNWPVNDYCRTNLLMGRTYGLDKGNKGLLAGFASNPMDKPEASKVGLFSIANWAWNVDGFDSTASWKASFPRLYPELSEEMYLFAKHNSDQGENGHGYRREESVEIKPVVDKALENYRKNGMLSKNDYELLTAEFMAIKEAATKLSEGLPESDPALWHEIEFWVKSFGSLGDAGLAAVKLGSGDAGNGTERMALFSRIAVAKADQKENFEAQKERHFGETFESDKRWATGCKVATLVLTPMLDEIANKEWAKAYQLLGGKASAKNSVYKAFSDAEGLDNIQADRDGIYVSMRRVMEVVKLTPKQHIGLSLPEGIVGSYIHVKLDKDEAAKACEIEISVDGENWKKFNARKGNGELQNPLNVADNIRYFRLVNNSDKQLEFRIEKFKFDIPADATSNSEAASTDGEPFSYYSFDEPKTFKGPKRAKKVYMITDAGVTTINHKGNSVTITPKNGERVRLFEIIWR